MAHDSTEKTVVSRGKFDFFSILHSCIDLHNKMTALIKMSVKCNKDELDLQKLEKKP
jgi:hypothetical protein